MQTSFIMIANTFIIGDHIRYTGLGHVSPTCVTLASAMYHLRGVNFIMLAVNKAQVQHNFIAVIIVFSKPLRD